MSLAYLQAVAAIVSFSVDVPHQDLDSIDAVISGKGRIAPDSLAISPRIELQLKASINIQPNNNGEIPFDLSIKNLNLWYYKTFAKSKNSKIIWARKAKRILKFLRKL